MLKRILPRLSYGCSNYKLLYREFADAKNLIKPFTVDNRGKLYLPLKASISDISSAIRILYLSHRFINKNYWDNCK